MKINLRKRGKKSYYFYFLILFFVIILLSFILKSIYNNSMNTITSFADCKIVEEKDGKLVFKRILGTFDNKEYGNDVFFILSPKITDHFKQLANKKNIDISDNILITVKYNQAKDINQEKNGVYIYIQSLVDVEQSNYKNPL